MNLNDKNIDQLFRKGAENMEAPEYSDAYWAEMNQLIDADASNRKKLLIWIFSGTLGAALVILLLFLDLGSITRNHSNIASNETDAKKHLKEQTEAKETVILDDSPEIITQESTSKGVTQQKSQTQLNATLNPTYNLESKAVNKVTSKKTSTAVKTNLGSTPYPYKKETANSKVFQENKPKSKSNSQSVTNTNTKEQLTSKQETHQVNKLMPKLISLETNTELNQSLLPLKNIMNRLRVSYHAEAAFGVSESYQNNSSSPWRSSLAGIIRFEYGQLVVNSGIGIQIESPANLQITERAKVYGFGLNNFENTLNYKSFTQLYLPLEIGYKSNNSTFGLGGQFHSIVSTRMALTSTVNQEVINQKNFNNQMAGLNRFSGNFYLWIDQQLTDKISAGVRVGSTIGSRISDSHYFNTVTNEHPIFGQLTLKYQLFK